MLLVNVILLVIGTVIDGIPGLIMVVPILLPIATDIYGIDPVHFGVVVSINLVLGLVSPPVGIALFIAAAVTKMKPGEIFLWTIPYCLTTAAVLVLLSVFPALTLYLGPKGQDRSSTSFRSRWRGPCRGHADRLRPGNKGIERAPTDEVQPELLGLAFLRPKQGWWGARRPSFIACVMVQRRAGPCLDNRTGSAFTADGVTGRGASKLGSLVHTRGGERAVVTASAIQQPPWPSCSLLQMSP
eukprot:gene51316-62753_t